MLQIMSFYDVKDENVFIAPLSLMKKTDEECLQSVKM